MASHTDKELKYWECTTQSQHRTGCLSPRLILLAERAGVVWRDVVASITKEQCVAELKRVVKQLGHTPTRDEFNNRASISTMPVVKLFGSWNDALTFVGLVPRHFQGFTKTKALSEIKRVAKLLGHTPTMEEFDKHACMCGGTVKYLLGTWSISLKVAGMVPNTVRDITKPQVLAELKRVAKLLRHTPNIDEFTEHASMSTFPVQRLYGSWNNALRAAGLTPNRGKRKKH